MARKTYFAKRDDKAKGRRCLRRQMNGYVPGAHKKEDAVRNKDKKLPKTKGLLGWYGLITCFWHEGKHKAGKGSK